MNIIVNNQLTLTRIVNHKTRYIALAIYPTLFNDIFLLQIEYGSANNTKPTGIIKKFFPIFNDATIYLKKYIHQKQLKGYA